MYTYVQCYTTSSHDITLVLIPTIHQSKENMNLMIIPNRSQTHEKQPKQEVQDTHTTHIVTIHVIFIA